MSGNKTQYDPAEFFREWIQRSGKAQTEFMKNFGSLMTSSQPSTTSSPTANSFDPLETLNEMCSKTRQTQSEFMENIASMQNKGMDAMFRLGQLLPNFLNYGAYKTTVGSNGRISIPEAERNALGIGEGDLVQVVVLPLARKSKEVKN